MTECEKDDASGRTPVPKMPPYACYWVDDWGVQYRVWYCRICGKQSAHDPETVCHETECPLAASEAKR